MLKVSRRAVVAGITESSVPSWTASFSEVNGGYFEKNHKLVKYIGFGTAYEKEEHVRSMATAILNFFLKRMITIVEQKKWLHRLEQ